MNSSPLTGRRVLVTRALHQAGKLSEGLRALGAEPVEVPVLEIRPPASYEPLDAALRQLGSYDWLILTSANTVRVLTERVAVLGISLQQPALPKELAPPQVAGADQPKELAPSQVAAVGEATATAARKAGLPVNFVPESYVAENLVAGLTALPLPAVEALQAAEKLGFVTGHDFSRAANAVEPTGALAPAEKLGFVTGHDFSRAANAAEKTGALAPEGSISGKPLSTLPFSGQRILLARAAVARDVIPDALRAAGAEVDVVDAYRNVLPEATPELLRRAMAAGLDAATFTSSSSATHLAEAAHAAGIAWPFAGVAAISIGPITSQTLRELGWEPSIEANPSDIPGLIAAIQSFFAD